jgi:hypothetical protein
MAAPVVDPHRMTRAGVLALELEDRVTVAKGGLMA